MREAVTSAPLVKRGVLVKTGDIGEAEGWIRGEEAAFAGQDGNVDIFAPGGFAHEAGEAVVEVLGERIELHFNV